MYYYGFHVSGARRPNISPRIFFLVDTTRELARENAVVTLFASQVLVLGWMSQFLAQQL